MAKIDKDPKKQKAQAGKVKKPVAPQKEKADTSFMPELRRQVEFAKKNPRPKGGGLEPTLDKPFWNYLSSGGPIGGFGVRSTGRPNLSKNPKTPGQSTMPDFGDSPESAYRRPKRPAKPAKADKDFIRKSNTKLTLKKVSNGKTTKK